MIDIKRMDIQIYCMGWSDQQVTMNQLDETGSILFKCKEHISTF